MSNVSDKMCRKAVEMLDSAVVGPAVSVTLPSIRCARCRVKFSYVDALVIPEWSLQLALHCHGQTVTVPISIAWLQAENRGGKQLWLFADGLWRFSYDQPGELLFRAV